MQKGREKEKPGGPGFQQKTSRPWGKWPQIEKRKSKKVEHAGDLRGGLGHLVRGKVNLNHSGQRGQYPRGEIKTSRAEEVKGNPTNLKKTLAGKGPKSPAKKGIKGLSREFHLRGHSSQGEKKKGCTKRPTSEKEHRKVPGQNGRGFLLKTVLRN